MRDNAAPRRTRRWLWLLAMPAIAGVGYLAIHAMMVDVGLAPGRSVVTGEEIPVGFRDTMRRAGLIHEGEQVRLFYSADRFSVLADGNLLTDRRVVSWQTRDEHLSVYSADLEEIAGVQLAYTGGLMENSVVEVRTATGDWFLLYVSTRDGGDERFLDELRRKIAGSVKKIVPQPL